MWSYNEDWVRSRLGPDLHGCYIHVGRRPAEDTDYDVWPSRVIANIYQNNLQPEEALSKVVKELQTELAKQQPVPNPHTDEHGQLSIREAMFIDEDGKYYNSLACSDFSLLKRFADGEDIDKIIQQRIDEGIREFRVLCSFNGSLGRFIPFEYSNYYQIVLGLIDKCEQAKRRLELVVFADAQSWCQELMAQKSFLRRIAELSDGRVLVNDELVNEYSKNGIDPTKFTKPNTSNLWSAGSGVGDQIEFPTVWDYITYHEGRPDDWPRRNNCRDIRTNYSVPVRSDEPIGADSSNIPGKRSNNPRDFYEFAVNQALNSNGLTIHSSAGVSSVLWQGLELDCIRAAVEGFNKVDASWFAGQYTRGGLSNCPLVHDDSKELRTFCRIVNNQARCIVIRSNHQDREADNGWSVTKIDGPNDEYVELEKP